MTLIKEQDNTPFPYATLMIVAGIIGILLGFRACNGPIDVGLLTSKEVTISARPVLVPGTKRAHAHYLLYTNEYLSPFQIIETAFSVVKENGGLQQIQVNDRVQVIFLTERQNRLDNPTDPVQIFGLTDAKQEYFNPGILAAREGETSNMVLICSSGLLIIGLILTLRKIKRSAPTT